MPLSILIVEDNPDAADSLAELLTVHGYEVRVARDGVAAVEAAARGRFDVVIVDVILPDADGYSVAGRLRMATGGRPVQIAVTGFPHLEGWSRANGFAHHFVKPVEPAVLCGLLGRYADRLTPHG